MDRYGRTLDPIEEHEYSPYAPRALLTPKQREERDLESPDRAWWRWAVIGREGNGG